VSEELKDVLGILQVRALELDGALEEEALRGANQEVDQVRGLWSCERCVLCARVVLVGRGVSGSRPRVSRATMN
jgi:hypothetical protein